MDPTHVQLWLTQEYCSVLVAALYPHIPAGNHTLSSAICTGQWSMMPARASAWTAICTQTDIVTLLLATAARSTSTVSVTLTPRLPTATPLASTLTEPISTAAVIIILICVHIILSEDSVTIEEERVSGRRPVHLDSMTVIIAIIIVFNRAEHTVTQYLKFN